MKKIGSVLFTSIIIALAWIICGLVCANYNEPTINYWGGFGFGLLTLVAVIISDFLLRTNGRATLEVNAIPVVYSFMYVIFGLIFNIVFMVKAKDIAWKFLVIGNVLLLIFYVLVIYFANKYRNRVTNQIDLTVSKTMNTVEIGSLVARLLSQAKDEDVKKRLYAFKEKIDYSTNISQGFTVEIEEELLENLRNIGRGLSDGISKEQILSEIDTAEDIWNMRNAKISTIR